MFRRMLSTVACLVLCGTTLAFAQNGCNPAPNGATNPGVLQFAAAAAPLPSHNVRLTIGQVPRPLSLVYLIPNAGSPLRPGILVVKIARENLSSPSRGGASTVHIERGAYPYVCGVPNIKAAGYLLGQYLGFSYSFMPVDDDVSLRDYITYHKTTTDYTQRVLYNFHVNYRDFQGICTRTDDKSNGNREQFLHGSDRELNNRIVWARVISGATAAAAQAAESLPYSEYWAVPAARRAQEAAKTYEESSQVMPVDSKYARLETQIHPYSTASSSCVPFEISNVQSGERITVTLNDLEHHESQGRRPRQRVEETWIFTAQ
jgi:hypothetical protein